MTRKERWLSAFALLSSILPFVVVAGTLQILPSHVNIISLTIPLETLRISKYSYLFLGLFSLVPLSLIIVARLLKAKGVVEHNFTAMVSVGLALGLLFVSIGLYGIIYQVITTPINLLIEFDFLGGAAVFLSLTMGMLANFLPDIKPNDFLGIKNRFTSSSDKVWKKVHLDIADIFMGGFFTLAVLLSSMSIGLDYRYGWVLLLVWFVASMGLFAWSFFYSKSVAQKLAKDTPQNNAAEIMENK